MPAAFNFPTQPNIAQRILQMGSSALMRLADTRMQSYRLFWSDPVVVASQLGTSAVAVFQADAALVAFLAPQLQSAGAPAAVIQAATAGIPANWAVTYNADGSVAITAVQPASAPNAK